MRQWRNTADGESGVLADELRAGHLHRLAELLRQALFAHAIGAAGFDKNGLAGLDAAKHKRLDDLPELAADGTGRFNGSARARGQFAHLKLRPTAIESVLNTLCGRRQTHGPKVPACACAAVVA